MPEWLSVGEEVKGSGERKERREGKREQRSKGRKEEEVELSSSSANFQ